MRKILSASVLFYLLVSNTAFSDTIRNFEVGHWYAGAFSRDGTNQFSHCAASATYRSGVTMLFSINKKYSWAIGFANPKWNLQPGSKFDLVFRIDNFSSLTGTAQAISPQQVSVALADNVELFSLFRRGHELRVFAAGQTFVFNLTDTGRVLPALLSCVSSYVNPTPANSVSANPFVAADKNAAPSKPRSNELKNRAEATVLLANILGQSSVSNYHVLPPDEMPKSSKVDVIWKTSDLIGTLTVFPTSKLDDVTPQIISGDAKSCKGKFVSGAMPADAGMVRVFTACDEKGKTTTVYYMAANRRTGGYYLMATADLGQSQSAKEADEHIRSAVQRILFQAK